MALEDGNNILTGKSLRDATRTMATTLEPIYGEREARAMAEIAVEHTMGYSPVDRALKAAEPVSDFRAGQLTAILNRLLNHEPLQYILGEAHFMGMKFQVNPAVLIPRPETEELVDIIIKENNRRDLRVLDIGTGSGCIAISLARGLKFPSVDALDYSHPALATAKSNAVSLKAKVNFIHGDALNLPAEPSPRYDIIVSNPPYIAWREKAQMDSNVIDHEPHSALFVPDDTPLVFYTAIMRYARTSLLPGGKIYFEINPLFTSELVTASQAMLPSSEITIIRDIQGKQRFAIITTDGSH